ncbi:TRAP transporter small permease [Pukyongiella litopenaei]|uniref:TRAP transporter small permease protein n=1 Tax=Pukyongiella litopenaei TaxID=2605946 RepID=A0A2S0MSJ3_9RHOB|nr:TRAP transporter small permease [Pukyongiella litopenaei]AVO38653.1 TRAP transporter small permease [Pukyongiella litopenaei]
MLVRFCDAVTRLVEILLSIGFFLLIVTVAYQVIGRALLSLPAIWTLDLAQLLFTWLIFVGAAVALRRHAHYSVDILPERWTVITRPLAALGIVAAAVVIYVLVIPGWQLASLRSTAVIPSLGLSMFWLFLALPVSGALMALYTIEHAVIFATGGVPPETEAETE